MSYLVGSDFYAHLAANGTYAKGEPNRQWFDASCERSRAAIEFAKAEVDRELTALVREGYGDQPVPA